MKKRIDVTFFRIFKDEPKRYLAHLHIVPYMRETAAKMIMSTATRVGTSPFPPS